jgi:hypothetical protein
MANHSSNFVAFLLKKKVCGLLGARCRAAMALHTREFYSTCLALCGGGGELVIRLGDDEGGGCVGNLLLAFHASRVVRLVLGVGSYFLL